MSEQNLQPRINASLCNSCGACILACPAGALGWQGEVAALVRPDLCTYCATCETICEPGAIELPYLIVKAGSSWKRGHNEG